MKAKPGHSDSVLHFYLRADKDSVPPSGVELGVMVFFLALSGLGVVSLLSSGSVLGALALALLCLLLLALPGRVRSIPEGFERRNIYGRGRSFETRPKTLWGRRCLWQDVKRFDNKTNGYRRWLKERLGEKRLVIRAKGMPVIEIHSSYPSYSQTLRWAEEKLPAEIFARPSLRERVANIGNNERENELPVAIVHRED